MKCGSGKQHSDDGHTIQQAEGELATTRIAAVAPGETEETATGVAGTSPAVASVEKEEIAGKAATSTAGAVAQLSRSRHRRTMLGVCIFSTLYSVVSVHVQLLFLPSHVVKKLCWSGWLLCAW